MILIMTSRSKSVLFLLHFQLTVIPRRINASRFRKTRSHEDPRIIDNSGEEPDQREGDEAFFAETIPLGVIGKFADFEEPIADIVDDEEDGPNAHPVGHPGYRQLDQRDRVMSEHLPKVFTSHVEELGDEERRIESDLQHVIPSKGIFERHVLGPTDPAASTPPPPSVENN